jgi:hypothetical protein
MTAGRTVTGHDRRSAEDAATAVPAGALIGRGFARVPGRWPDRLAAWQTAVAIAACARDRDPLCAGLPALEVVGEFTVPPQGLVQRDFQALHIDYGLPKLGGPPVAVSRFTALYLDPGRAGSGSATRIVPLRPLLGQRSWPARAVICERLCRDAGEDSLVEGILARIVESADQSRDLPPQDTDGFACGLEFATLAEERRYFAEHGLHLRAAEEELVLSSGELLLFDNLLTAHGRRGRRHSGELHQLCIGFPSLDLPGQTMLLDRILTAFDAPSGG